MMSCSFEQNQVDHNLPACILTCQVLFNHQFHCAVRSLCHIQALLIILFTVLRCYIVLNHPSRYQFVVKLFTIIGLQCFQRSSVNDGLLRQMRQHARAPVRLQLSLEQVGADCSLLSGGL